MGQSLDKMKRAAIAFVDQLRPNDFVFVVTFDSDLHALHEKATNDHKILRDAIMSAQLGGNTSLLDAVLTITGRLLNPVQGRKALILFTDGGENSSVAGTKKNTVHLAEELDALMYAVHYFPFAGSDYLKRLAELTGGRLYRGTNEKEIAAAFTSLADELRQQYAVAYYPSLTSVPGQMHNVRVTVTREGVHVKSRKTYKVRQ
jgi:VWFA-related protein